jgi:hypothetical protein
MSEVTPYTRSDKQVERDQFGEGGFFTRVECGPVVAEVTTDEDGDWRVRVRHHHFPLSALLSEPVGGSGWLSLPRAQRLVLELRARLDEAQFCETWTGLCAVLDRLYMVLASVVDMRHEYDANGGVVQLGEYLPG